MLRVYVFSYPKPARKSVFKRLAFFFSKTTEQANLYLMEANSSYYSLSEEDRFIIESIVSLSL